MTHVFLFFHLLGAFCFFAGGAVVGVLQLAAIRQERPSQVHAFLRLAPFGAARAPPREEARIGGRRTEPGAPSARRRARPALRELCEFPPAARDRRPNGLAADLRFKSGYVHSREY